ncbi:MAG: hypothetical protein QXU93_08120 [Thermoproteus sp.]
MRRTTTISIDVETHVLLLKIKAELERKGVRKTLAEIVKEAVEQYARSVL